MSPGAVRDDWVHHPAALCSCQRLTHHVALAGVDTVSQALNGDPLDWHLGNASLAVVVPIVDLLGESEVRHTHGHVLVQPARVGERNRVIASAPSTRKTAFTLRHISISRLGSCLGAWVCLPSLLQRQMELCYFLFPP